MTEAAGVGAFQRLKSEFLTNSNFLIPLLLVSTLSSLPVWTSCLSEWDKTCDNCADNQIICWNSIKKKKIVMSMTVQISFVEMEILSILAFKLADK